MTATDRIDAARTLLDIAGTVYAIPDPQRDMGGMWASMCASAYEAEASHIAASIARLRWLVDQALLLVLL